ncbi:MAG: hypothetical protein JNM21_12480 [Taibaiella sp.]|nr:hypothetical protein [Taibaiella sp.]
MATRPFRMTFSDEFYVVNDELLFLKLLTFSILDLVILYTCFLLLGYWLRADTMPNKAQPVPEANTPALKVISNNDGTAISWRAIIVMALIVMLFIFFVTLFG